MAYNEAVRAIRALECLSNLMDLCDEFDKDEQKKKKRKIFIKSEDVQNHILKDIAWKHTDSEESFCPLSMENFDELYIMISAKINKNALLMPSLSLRMRLAITLRYLIAGESYRILEPVCHVSRKYLARIIPEMLKHLVNILENDYLNVPKTQKEWTNEARDFETFWDFPHTLGVLEAKNFRVKSLSTQPCNQSLILLSIIDAHSRFKYIEFIKSEESRCSSIYASSKLYKSLITNSLNIPSEKPLKGQTDKTPYFFVANPIFSLDPYTVIAYEQNSTIRRIQKAFNFRIKRASLPAQMAFEIILFRFKIFNRLNEVDIEKAKLVIKACCLLHNYLTQKLNQPLDYNDEITKFDLPGYDTSLPKQINIPYETESKIRKNISQYCVSEGNIPEQWLKII